MRNDDAYLTISVDDGHPADFRTADLLARYGLKATFYIPKTNPEREVMDESGITELARSFEIGGHTYSHRPLRGLSEESLHRELAEGKDWLQQLLGQEVVSFCYPQGKFDRKAVTAVERCGFKGARTCMYNRFDFPENPFLWGVTTQANSHSRTIQMRHALLEGNFSGLFNYLGVLRGAVDWVQHFQRGIDHVSRRGGIAHLYLHSWEIDAMNQWHRLEEVFGHLSERNGINSVTNGELFAMYGRSQNDE